MAATAGAHDAIDDVRAFNRFYTRVIGVLDDGVVETSYSLPEARVLFELAQVDEGEVGEVRRSLGIDAGYLSRMLARFEAQGLIARRRSASDARRQLVQLTDLGRSEFAMLDGRSADQVGGLIGRLGEGEQRRLVTAMAAIRELLGDTPRAATPVLREPEPGDYGWIVERHGALYAAEYGWNSHIESLAARAIGEFMEHRDPRARARLDRRGRRRARGLRAVREAKRRRRAAPHADRRAERSRARPRSDARRRVHALRP